MTIAAALATCPPDPPGDTPGDAQAAIVLRFPWLHRTLWFRLARLAHHRGAFDGVLDPAAMWDFLAFVANEADAAGRLGADRMPHLKAKFAAARGWTSGRQAARYQRALLDLGWLEQTQRPAPGHRSRFQLVLRYDLLPGDLPEDLARQMPYVWNGRDDLPEPDDTDAAYGHLTSRAPVPVVLTPPGPPRGPEEPREDDPADARTTGALVAFPPGRVDLGPLPRTRHLFAVLDPDIPQAAAPRPADTSSSVTSLTRRPVTPMVWKGDHRGDKSDFSQYPGRTHQDRWVPPPRPGPPDGDELAAAYAVLDRCGPWWARQRGPGHGTLSADQAAGLADAVAYALRRATASEVVELATVGVRSAHSLPHVVGARLWAMIRGRGEHDRTRPPAVAADEDHVEYARMLAERAALQRTGRAGPGYRAATAARRALADQNAARHADQEAADPRAARPFAREDEQTLATERAWDDFVRHGDPLDVYRTLATRSAHRTENHPAQPRSRPGAP